VGPRATEKHTVGFSEPLRVDIENDNDHAFTARTVIIAVVLPDIDRNGGVAPQGHGLAFDHEFLVRACGLEDEVTMRMGV